MNNFLPITEHDKSDINNEDALNTVIVREDNAHITVRFSVKKFRLSASSKNLFSLRTNIILS
jgi:hypothetical protein